MDLRLEAAAEIKLRSDVLYKESVGKPFARQA
jgi:hypothetical protein